MAGIGLFAASLAALLIWIHLSAQVNSRQPIPSPDGKYLAYFDDVGPVRSGGRDEYQLIVSMPGGRETARFSTSPGLLSWSNADDLAVINGDHDRAVLIANSDGRFLRVNELRFTMNTEPRWSTDGTKIAYVQAGPAGEAVSVYDFLQTRSAPAPIPAGFHLNRPRLLFWSPGGEALYFLNATGKSVDLDRLDFMEGQIHRIAAGAASWLGSAGAPQIAPDGAKIFLPLPINSVIDSQSGRTLWMLPPGGKIARSTWSPEGRRIYYRPNAKPGLIIGHDLNDSREAVVLNNAPPGGFLTSDGRSYFYRSADSHDEGQAGGELGIWLRSQWGWRQKDTDSHLDLPLGRSHLLPWADSSDGLFLMAQDDYLRVRYGLYNPRSRNLSEFLFPTFRQDLLQTIKAQAFTLMSVLVYAGLAVFTFARLTRNSSTCTLYLLSLTLMVLFAGMSTESTFLDFHLAPTVWSPADPNGLTQYWHVTDFRLALLGVSRTWFEVALTLLPLILFHLVLIVSNGNRFWMSHNTPRRIAYGAAALPLVAVVGGFNGQDQATVFQPVLPILFGVAVGIVILAAIVSMRGQLPSRAEQPQLLPLRWAIIVLGIPLAGLAGQWVLHNILARLK